MNNKDTRHLDHSEFRSCLPGALEKSQIHFFYYTTEIQNCLAYEFHYKDSWLRDKKVTTEEKNPDSEGDFTTKAPVRLSVRGSCQG